MPPRRKREKQQRRKISRRIKPEGLLSRKKVAQILHTNPERISYLLDFLELPHERIGKAIYITPEQMDSLRICMENPEYIPVDVATRMLGCEGSKASLLRIPIHTLTIDGRKIDVFRLADMRRAGFFVREDDLLPLMNIMRSAGLEKEAATLWRRRQRIKAFVRPAELRVSYRGVPREILTIQIHRLEGVFRYAVARGILRREQLQYLLGIVTRRINSYAAELVALQKKSEKGELTEEERIRAAQLERELIKNEEYIFLMRLRIALQRTLNYT
ncbi:MAG: hypothetical protein J7L14_00170 [Candidatus Diapherotrites archaeon]|nr:hypothetical protein [Candidatus Diapherotrites archaeon]